MHERLIPRLTPDFLATLVEAAKTCGWQEGDYWETMAFVRWCHDQVGRVPPDLTPYPPPCEMSSQED
jgi:hypothetical protein